MADDNDKPHDTAQPSPQPDNAAPPADTGVPATPPAADASAETPATEGEEGQEPPKPKARGGFQKRIGELTAKNRELERRLAEATAPKGAGQGDADAPKRESYSTYEEYIRAEAAHAARQAVADEERTRAEKAVAAAKDERIAAFSMEMNTDAADDPAFQKAWQTVTAQGYPISEAMFDFVSDSDDPHSLIEWLASNRGEAAKLYSASPGQVTRTLARVEAGLVSKPPARTPQAPPPPPTVNGRASPRVDMARLAAAKNPDEYIARRREEMAKAR